MLLLSLACSDYQLNRQEDVPGGLESGIDDVCDNFAAEAGEVSMLEECIIEPTVGGWTPQMEWENSAPGDTYTTPVIGHLDGDANPEVVVANTAGVLYALDGVTGQIEWSGGSFGSEPMTAAIGDLDGDGRAEVVGSGSYGTTAFYGNGTVMWQTSAVPSGNTPQCGAVGIHDLDGDGLAEVVVGNLILRGTDGSTRAVGTAGSGAGHPWAAPMGVAADINLDGTLEVVVGNALYDADGTTLWNNGQSDGFVAVGNFDDDDYGEIVVTREGTLRLQDDTGSVIWTRAGLTGSTIGPPTVADFDADGEPEIGVAGNGVYMMVDTDGTTMWANSTQDYSSGFTGSAVFDFEGDGIAEVVYADENSVWVYNGLNGEVKLEETRHSSATCSEYPAVADVDADGHAEIIYTSSSYTGSETGVRVIGDANDSWQSSREVWNQHGYSVTNVEEDGSIPASVEPNWLRYNTFRSGDVLAGLQGELPDLTGTIDVCEAHCDVGEVVVWVQVMNQGVADVVDAFPVGVYAVTTDGHVLLEEQVVTEGVRAGRSNDAIEFRVDITGLEVYALVAKIDGGDDSLGLISDCDEWNDAAVWGDRVCE